MNKNAILQQKTERDKILISSFLPREAQEAAKKRLESDLVKVIVGPRRAGKSVFCHNVLKGKNYGYLNFDEDVFLGASSEDLISGLSEVYGETHDFLFDEIQNFPHWELFANKLQRRGFNLFLTGSNSKLLKGDWATALTGRYFEIEILPFSFREYLLAEQTDENKKNSAFEKYLKTGGFPEVVLKKYEPETYLASLFDSILLNDVVKRHKVKYSKVIGDLGSMLLGSFSCLTTSQSLKRKLEARSTTTVEKYSSYLEEAYLIQFLPRYSFKIGVSRHAPRKTYAIDNGYISAKASQFSENSGRLLEDLIFVELLRRGYKPGLSLFYYQTRNGKEVDFVLRRGTKTEKLIQVCADLNTENSKREVKALQEAGDELDCRDLSIISMNKMTLSIPTISQLDFLLTPQTRN